MSKHYHNFHLFVSLFLGSGGLCWLNKRLMIASYLASWPRARLPAGAHSQIAAQAGIVSDTQTSGRHLPLCLQTPSPGSSDPSADASGHAGLETASADGVFPLYWLASSCRVLMTACLHPVHSAHDPDSEL